MVTKRAIVLDWRASPQCNAEFLDLFMQPDGLTWDHASVRYNFDDSTNMPPGPCRASGCPTAAAASYASPSPQTPLGPTYSVPIDQFRNFGAT
ncbi:hypothetical protein BG006_002638 [Podila minutissima]|uniref:Uncharacterized protein n=1 Tax=Podila minutissima TaxID=64525 RepID=A0A9P5S9N8_9FUNG|nr:hypothetical protein BG006_002638 [Podila minutissima]